ncbi:DsbA family protein [Patescibacteria group bacterium]|nr:DsbA family protein [Patescibacteria group bacterium]MDE2021380.1 thioredoxin domain-containing protein [Patescibacteria group bacterium]MDE2173375.1 thioredoxin domain-containing protein [Patescibacteria group bacterium]
MDNNEISSKFFLPAAVVLAGLFIAGAVVWNGSHPSAGTAGTAPSGAGPAVNIKDVKTDGDPFIGQPDAPITIAFWSDFQCPFCKQFELNTLPQVVKDYVDAGKAKVVFLDFAFLGPNSMVDAEYARAVWALYPSQYFAWRSAFYNQQPQENSLNAADNLSFITKITDSISGIDASKVAAAVKTNQTTYDAAINADRTEGQKFGVNATPSFIIGTQLLAGAYPYANFQAAIDPLLK